MIVVGYDPAAGAVVVTREDGAPVFTAPADRLVAKQYRDAGILYCDFAGEQAALAYYLADGTPAGLALARVAPACWRFVVGPVSGPQPSPA